MSVPSGIVNRSEIRISQSPFAPTCIEGKRMYLDFIRPIDHVCFAVNTELTYRSLMTLTGNVINFKDY